MNSCQSCSALFHKRGTHFILKTNTTHRKWKWTEKSDIWPPCSIQKRAEIFAKSFFQTLDAIFSYKGVFFINVLKTNIIAFIKTNFLTPILSVKNTPFRFFCFFFPSLHINLVKKISFPIFWGVKKASCQIFHVLDENWRRNNFPKLTTLWLPLHANVTNFPIVQCPTQLQIQFYQHPSLLIKFLTFNICIICLPLALHDQLLLYESKNDD